MGAFTDHAIRTKSRTCEFCGIDKGSLQEVRFYDYEAVYPKNELPIQHGGFLNCVLICGDSDCLETAMRHRATELAKVV